MVSAQSDMRALQILEASFDMDEAERAAFVEAQCAGDAEVGAKVRRMLEIAEAEAVPFTTEALSAPAYDPDTLPERIGIYLVSGILGRGGMGTVVRAERDDGLFTQSVAIKIMHVGLRGETERLRFDTERRLLARLSHPSITRILDGGEVEGGGVEGGEGRGAEGRPYLVMELVEGREVSADLDERAAGLPERLDVFAAIAGAVAYAHRMLVIHGDIKPSNVIRTVDGAVKLLDFGIGRLAEGMEADTGAYPITRAFASPARLSGEPPSVASDVFSLGVLLHHLLAGRLPEAGRRLSQAVCAAGPIPALQLEGDLDAIVAMATAADPAQRYPDVAALAADIDRHRACRLVAARPPVLSYRVKRFVRRNRVLIATISLVLLILIAATSVSTLSFFHAREQQAAAEARFEELRSLAKFQLFELYDRLAETPGTTAARARLAGEAQTYLDRLASVPDAPADLRLDVAQGLDRLASVQGVPRFPNLGQQQQARENLARAATILDQLAAQMPQDQNVAAEQMRNRMLRAQVTTWLDFRTDLARQLLGGAVLPDGMAATPAGRNLEAFRRTAWLDLLGWEEKYPEARREADAMLTWLDQWPTGERPLIHMLATTDALNARGDARYYLEDVSGALEDYRRADAMLLDAERRFPPNASIFSRLMSSGYNVVTTLEGLGRRAEMPALALALVARGERTLALEANDDTLRRRHFVNRELAAQTLASVGRFQEAVEQQQPLVAERAELLRLQPGEPQANRDLAFSRSVLGTLYWYRQMRAEACAEWRAADAILTPLERAGSLNAFDRDRNLGYIRYNLAICRGERPASAFRPPE